MDRCVVKFIEADVELEKENYDKSVELLKKIRQDNPNPKEGEKRNISDEDMAELIRLEKEYRKIPKEADADEFAKKMMEQLDIEEFLMKLGK